MTIIVPALVSSMKPITDASAVPLTTWTRNPTVGFLVQVVKGTALASVIGFIELTKAGTMITNATFRPFTVYACLALMYFALCYPISAWSKSLERKLHGQR